MSKAIDDLPFLFKQSCYPIVLLYCIFEFQIQFKIRFCISIFQNNFYWILLGCMFISSVRAHRILSNTSIWHTHIYHAFPRLHFNVVARKKKKSYLNGVFEQNVFFLFKPVAKIKTFTHCIIDVFTSLRVINKFAEELKKLIPFICSVFSVINSHIFNEVKLLLSHHCYLCYKHISSPMSKRNSSRGFFNIIHRQNTYWVSIQVFCLCHCLHTIHLCYLEEKKKKKEKAGVSWSLGRDMLRRKADHPLPRSVILYFTMKPKFPLGPPQYYMASFQLHIGRPPTSHTNMLRSRFLQMYRCIHIPVCLSAQWDGLLLFRFAET